MRVITGSGPKIRDYLNIIGSDTDAIIFPEAGLDSFEQSQFINTVGSQFDGDIITLSDIIISTFDKSEVFILGKKSDSLTLAVDINGTSIMTNIKKVHKCVSGVDTSIDEINLDLFHCIYNYNKTKEIVFQEDMKTILSIKHFPEIKNESLSDKIKRLQIYLDAIPSEDIFIHSGEDYYFNSESNSIIEDTGRAKFLEGNGILKIVAEEFEGDIKILVKLLPKYLKEYTFIPLLETDKFD